MRPVDYICLSVDRPLRQRRRLFPLQFFRSSATRIALHGLDLTVASEMIRTATCLTPLCRIAPTAASDSLESPTCASSRLSQESLSSLDYHPRRPGLDDKRIPLNTFLSAATPPWAVQEINNRQKMHQIPSRLLRRTDDDRPFTKVSPSANVSPCSLTHPESLQDLKDPFSTLIVSLGTSDYSCSILVRCYSSRQCTFP